MSKLEDRLLYSLTIPAVPQSLNKLLRTHWAARRKYNQKWQWYIRQQLTRIPYKIDEKKLVHIHQTRSRLLDEDNLYGSVKAIVDGLRYWNILWDDSPEYIDLNVTQETGKPVCTSIKVYLGAIKMTQ